MIRHTSLQTASTIPSLQEKEELLNLNSRFSAYIQLVREMHEKDNSLDSTELFKAMQKFENDLNNLKLMYEKELEKLREQLDVLGREKDHYCLMYGKSDDLAKELNIKLQAEIDNSTKLVDEINILQRKITELEKELIDLHQLSQQPVKELAELHRHLDTVKQELQGVRKKHEREQMMRQEAENKLSRLKEKLHFQERIAEQQIQELRDQLQKTSATILGLEMRVRELSKSDNSTLQLLKKVQETAQEELLRYKKEAEAEYSKNLTALKIQLDNSTFLVENLTLDKYRLQDEVAELLAKISELEGQLASIEHQNNNLEDLMIKDRNHAAVQIHQLEKKLRELQDLIYLKLQEARNTRVPMMTEIKAFQLLLEEEEKRIQCPPMPSTMTFPVTPSKGMSYKSASSTSELVGPVMTSTSRVTTSPGACNMGLLQGRSAPQVTSKSAPKITSIQHQAATHASSPRVTFKMTPNVNRLSVDRAVSAPPPGYIKTMSKYKVKQKPTGQGPEYFQELFGSQTTRNIPIQHLKTRKPSHYNHQTFTPSLDEAEMKTSLNAGISKEALNLNCTG